MIDNNSKGNDSDERFLSEEQTAHLKEKILARSSLFEGHYLKGERLDVRLPDGGESSRDVIRHPGAVAILAVNEAGQILMEYQYRTAVDAVILEIPAGKVDPQEDRLEAAKRELEEETGWRAKSWLHLGELMLAPGYCDECISLFRATQLYPGEVHRDEDEEMIPLFFDRSDLLKAVKEQKITDSKTLCALFYGELLQEGAIGSQTL
ncbi:ADP-ribose pyrophosphatase [Clostridiaceae bacterium JG1575]|nr:ADP-ribose pyrophosphatase [Clostridiaceae bacterium JG1575]